MIADKGARTPFLVLHRSMVRENLAKLSRALPGVAIHYAVKSNNHRAILEEVTAAGYSFDIASYNELVQSAEAGGDVEGFIHSHPIKSPDEIENAVNSGVSLFVVDNPDEIGKFAAYADKVRLLIRFKVRNSSAVVNLSYKFGCEPANVLLLADRIRILGIKYHGLTFHVGSQCTDSEVYTDAIETASRLIDKLKGKDFDTRLLDIGGGFPVAYTDKIPSIYEFCRPIRRALKEKINPDIAIACEPGRFISASAVTLVASVIGASIRSRRPWYFLDDGLYGSFSGRLYDHCLYQVYTNRNTTWKRSVLAGPTCDSFDVIYNNVLLPPLKIGDILLFPSMGAYCSVSASTFNSLRKAEYIVID
ncbi:MAG: type III PLP-dependent enzyme [Candidatus Zixiibacteriota bacterium]|nr:MAG: type III PLP-dependent enzyme [candidate division Zixibacteria bacterium]